MEPPRPRWSLCRPSTCKHVFSPDHRSVIELMFPLITVTGLLGAPSRLISQLVYKDPEYYLFATTKNNI
ncbi:hypothetical protein EYF80_050230 [Liparis tanakae]|uniref:Uncharacterized protein n=1 Tax=Liparis tanakae TaxID=230148 RepID=A0A4Z2FFC5_9TELE|nr:hypothetical protein EYF80_050230 [Liparis tanakae]